MRTLDKTTTLQPRWMKICGWVVFDAGNALANTEKTNSCNMQRWWSSRWRCFMMNYYCNRIQHTKSIRLPAAFAIPLLSVCFRLWNTMTKCERRSSIEGRNEPILLYRGKKSHRLYKYAHQMGGWVPKTDLSNTRNVQLDYKINIPLHKIKQNAKLDRVEINVCFCLHVPSRILIEPGCSSMCIQSYLS